MGLLLYKDHHRRLFQVIFTMTTVISFLVWMLVTMPYVIQMFGLVAKMDTYFRLDKLSPFSRLFFETVMKSIPLVHCFILFCLCVCLSVCLSLCECVCLPLRLFNCLS